MRRGAGPDTAALGLGEDRTNDRLPADPRSSFALLGLEPITRGRPPGFSNQSDAETEQAAGKPTLSKGGWQDASGGATFPLLSLLLPRPQETDRARGSNYPHLPTHPTQGAMRVSTRLRTHEAVTDRPFTPTRTRQLCFHTRREEKRPISDKS